MKASTGLARPRLLGALALAGWSAHAGALVSREAPHALLWCCNLGALLVALGLLAGRPRLAGVGLLWVASGTPIWVVALGLGQTFLPTSLLTHFGALAAGLAAQGAAAPGGCWRAAWAGLLGLHLLSHAAAPPGRSLNLADVAPGGTLAGHVALIALCGAVAAVVLPALESFLRARAQPDASSTASRAASSGSSTTRTPST